MVPSALMRSAGLAPGTTLYCKTILPDNMWPKIWVDFDALFGALNEFVPTDLGTPYELV